ncbi:MAG: 2-phospho-L-lactate guanylyltransferase [Anaerolineales bacterium]
MRDTWAIVPVKPLREGKSRLSTILEEDQRWALNRWLLEHTLQVLNESDLFEHILLISRDGEALAVGRKYAARTIQEEGLPKLNGAVERATRYAQQTRAESVLIIPTDLPLLDQDTLKDMSSKTHHQPYVIIAPDRHQKGTNALWLSPPGKFAYHFGVDSFQAHLAEASQNGNDVAVFQHPNIALDIDDAEDLRYLVSLNKSIPILEIIPH